MTAPATVTIGHVSTAVLAFQGRPVCTTAQLARFYGCTEKNLLDNFANHEPRFSVGTHYFRIEGEELRGFKADIPDDFGDVPARTARLLLWTEKGAARHAKMLTTEKAWEVFEALEDRYFRPANAAPALSRLEVLQLAMEAEKGRLEAEAKLTAQAPKVAFAEAVGAAENDQSIEQVAKTLGTGRNRLFAFLRQHGVLMPNNMPYQRHVDQLRFRVIEVPEQKKDGTSMVFPQTRVTGKGITYVQQLWAKAHEGSPA
jgi:phage antirepressor YoqD-like protein